METKINAKSIIGVSVSYDRTHKLGFKMHYINQHFMEIFSFHLIFHLDKSYPTRQNILS